MLCIGCNRELHCPPSRSSSEKTSETQPFPRKAFECFFTSYKFLPANLEEKKMCGPNIRIRKQKAERVGVMGKSCNADLKSAVGVGDCGGAGGS